MILRIWGFIFNQIIPTLKFPTLLPPFFLLSSCRKKKSPWPCWNYLFDLLSIAFVIIILPKGLLQRILPSAWPLKWLSSGHCPPVDVRKKEMNTFLCLRLAILGGICKINAFLLCFLTSPHLWSLMHKRTWHPDPVQDSYLEILFCNLLSQPAPPNKVISCLNTSWIHWPDMWQAERAWTQ